MKAFRHIVPLLLLVCSAALPVHGSVAAIVAPEDTVETKPRFEVAKTTPDNEDDLKKKSADLKTPENLKTETTYDERTHTYLIGTKIGDSYLSVPLLMTPEEYQQWSMKRSLDAFFRAKNEEEFEKEGKKEKFDFSDMHFDLGPAEKIFGPGGVQIRTQGTAELKFGFNQKSIDNPTLPLRSRNTFGFDFDEKINLSINGKVGDKINMNMNYNTEATFNYDTKKMKLKYEGKEDEIIKLLEAGNVSFPTNSSLITGSTSLFGIRADLQFGKLSLQTVLSQKTSQSTSVSSKGGKQLTEFEVDVADYDENRHFFLAHYFRDTYDQNMAQLPTIMSGIKITRIELWITNKTSSYDNPRNVIAFTDLGEADHISNPTWRATGTTRLPANTANDLYYQMVNTYGAVRDIDQVGAVFGGFLSGSADYEKISNARLLSSSEYTLNSTLGYISLRTTLKSDEVLAVAFEYTYGGKTWQVGEFAADQKEGGKALYVKLLKSNSMSPSNGTWDLMMKNIYSLGAKSLSSTDFRLNIEYESDSTGTNLTYLPEASLKGKTLLQLVNLDRLDNKQNSNPNGFFDYVEGYTVQSSTGRIIFPVVEPFGGWLRKVIGNDAVADKYVFEELYDSTKTTAKQIAEKNKFLLTGEFAGSGGGSVISLGAYNVPRGSVKVTAGGVTLTENSDYTVDYTQGEVTIINQSIIDAGTAINVSMESNTAYNMQRKSMMGLNWGYDFTKDFKMGGTLLYLNEKPLTSKVSMGSEPLKNTLWGLNMAWKRESQLLTNILDYIPGLHVTQPSSINFTAEFAQLIAGVSDMVQGSASYIDDFESSERDITLNTPSAWMLASIPSSMPNATLTNDLRTGMDRALFNWYSIDPLFTRRNSSLTPAHLKSDLEQLSNHYIREVYERELYPNKESTYGESSTLNILNLAYYPNERGPYNLDTDLTPDGKLTNPRRRWGGIMRQLTTTDFETSNIEYIEFWMMDPFIYNPEAEGGDFYINIGEVSEDILKDGKKFYENGMTATVNTTDSINYVETVWGHVPKALSLVYAFDNNSAARDRQDVGLNGLTSDE
ncbi:MAG: cell surface protein SprA, partial [Bacteroidaceae bacterium]|nr:cell surface protein SprA [Bacteroidaceae bacterium]